jgi:hypothetical protein
MDRLEIARSWHQQTKARLARAALGLRPEGPRRQPRMLARVIWPKSQPAKAKAVPRPSDINLRWQMDAHPQADAAGAGR